MPNYYEFLGLETTATDEDIKSRIDSLYNDSRRLVTHHDPQVVQNASQALLMIEQARSILLDPSKRCDYDLSIGIGNIGGVADPSAQKQNMAFAVPPLATSISRQNSIADSVTANRWICPKCKTPAPIGTRFCKKCGQVLGKPCPKCSVLLEANAQFCSECGVSVREYERELEVQTAEAERHRIAEQKRLAQIQGVLGPVIQQADKASSMMKTGCVVGFFLSFIGMPFWIISVVNARKVLSAAQVPGDEEYRQKAKTALTVSGIALGIYVAIIGIFLLLGLVSLISGIHSGGY